MLREADETLPLPQNEVKVRAAQVHAPIIEIPNPFDPKQNPNYGPRVSLLESEASPIASDSKSRAEVPVEWPKPLDREAFHGLAGEYVRAVEPYTEADVASLLVQLLVGFGSVIGRSAYFSVEATQHYGNLFCVLVGESSKARKGTSWSHIRRLLESIDHQWAGSCIQSGLITGEGLSYWVRDQVERQEAIKDKGRVTGYQMVVVDEGVSDKRLLMIETEFSSPLRVANRDGNTLSCVVRQAWDDGNLRVMAKNSHTKATGAHVSIIGHITKDELVRHITTTDLGNGYANRFLWVCSKRSKYLPEGGNVPALAIAPVVQKFMDVADFAKATEQVQFDAEARALWHKLYPVLSSGGVGLLGAVTNRAEAQVVRLSMLYALLDKSKHICVEHLRAGLAVWVYCEASAKTVFGETFGDPVVDELLVELRRHPSGLTRTEIRDFFGRHRSTAEIDRALRVLSARGVAHMVKETDTGGRPIERWIAGIGTTK